MVFLHVDLGHFSESTPTELWVLVGTTGTPRLMIDSSFDRYRNGLKFEWYQGKLRPPKEGYRGFTFDIPHSTIEPWHIVLDGSMLQLPGHGFVLTSVVNAIPAAVAVERGVGRASTAK